MEAGAQFRQARISKGLVALVAFGIALGLGGFAASAVARNSSAPAVTQTHFVQSQAGPASTNPVRHGGTRILPDSVAPTPNSHPAAPINSEKPGYF
jgi:hypothetical protein